MDRCGGVPVCRYSRLLAPVQRRRRGSARDDPAGWPGAPSGRRPAGQRSVGKFDSRVPENLQRVLRCW